MNLVSVNVGMPREVIWKGMTVRTSIFKESVDGPKMVKRLNIQDDGQANLAVHGGEDKAVYAYPAEHYEYWRQELPDVPLPWGIFGENLTTNGLRESSVHVGDQFSIGSAEFVVTQPRMPCYKLGIRFQSDDMVKRFLASGRSGFYFAVSREGEIRAGDRIKPIARDDNRLSISEIVRLYVAKTYSEEDVTFIRRALRVVALPENWKTYFRNRLQNANAHSF
jgi:MOSC domain-containing protein YiiM